MQQLRLGGTSGFPFSPLRVPGPGPRPLPQPSVLPPDVILLPDELSNAWPIPGTPREPLYSLTQSPLSPPGRLPYSRPPAVPTLLLYARLSTSAHPRAFHSFADTPEVGMGDNGSACHAHSHSQAVTAFPCGALSPKPTLGGGRAHCSTPP